MATFKIESEKVKGKIKLTKKCNLVSDQKHEVMVGSGYCKNKCGWCKSFTKEEVNCGFKRFWK